MNAGFLVDMWMFTLGFSYQTSYVNYSTSSWTWIWGVSTVSPATKAEYASVLNYSTKGMFSSYNNPMGRAGHSMIASDSSQSLLVFGGSDVQVSSYHIYFNDLWEFNVTSQQWAWIAGGSTDPQNGYSSADSPGKYPPTQNYSGTAFQYFPSARTGHAACSFGSDSFYVFGGQNYNSTFGEILI
jgi:N-acetylneuraminic acid mutarotase